MRRIQRGKCLSCRKLFIPDPRTRHKQRYCGEAVCQRASHRASQWRWWHKPENRNYFRDPMHVKRMQQWRLDHRELLESRRKKGKRLHDERLLQLAGREEEEPGGVLVLHDERLSQPAVLLGLIASFTGVDMTLHDEIEQTVKKMHAQGQAILGMGPGMGKQGAWRHVGSQTCVESEASTAGAAAIQLGGSSADTG